MNEKNQLEIDTKSCMIRRYQERDCEALIDLFYDTVHSVNARDYSLKQRNAWATGKEDCKQWHQSFLAHETYVSTINDKVVGFDDINQTGYLDCLFVHKDYKRQGIATALCNQLERFIQSNIMTDASITAKSFFEKRGYQVLQEQKVARLGVYLTNFKMEKRRFFLNKKRIGKN